MISRRTKIVSYLYFKIISKALNPFNASFRFSYSKKNTNRTIYMADGSIVHGGLTDRNKGLLTSYYLAKKHNTPFSIFYISPVNYANFWHSNKINITKLIINPFKFKVWLVSSIDELKELNEVKSEVFLKKTNLLYVNENILAYLNNNGNWEKPTQKLYNELDLLGENHVKTSFKKDYFDYVSKDFEILHFRCLNYLNDFDDSKILPIAEDQIIIALDKLRNHLEEQHENLKNKVFISDSRRLLNYFKDKGYRVFSTKTTKHMDNPGHSIIEYMRGYQENHLITFAKSVNSYTFYFNRQQPFNSHFAYYPAIFGNVPFHKFGYNLKNFMVTDLIGEK